MTQNIYKRDVKNQVRKVKKDFELEVVDLLKKGLNPAKISIEKNISLPALSYYLSSLKDKNVIKQIGYGVWEVIPSGEVKLLSHNGNSQLKDVRGHAFIWKIKPNKKFRWIELLNSKGIKYTLKGFAKTPRIFINNKKVWLGQTYITIFEPKWSSFFAVSPIESKKEAVFSMLDIIEEIKKITGEFKYTFTCKRHHYGFINNKEAMHFIKQGKKILIKNEKGYWFSIDYSQNTYKEAETIHEKDALIDGMGYQKLMNSHEKTSFKVTPEFILETFNGIQQNQVVFDKNMASHVKAVQNLGEGVSQFNEGFQQQASAQKKIIEDLHNEIKELRKPFFIRWYEYFFKR